MFRDEKRDSRPSLRSLKQSLSRSPPNSRHASPPPRRYKYALKREEENMDGLVCNWQGDESRMKRNREVSIRLLCRDRLQRNRHRLVPEIA